jgi:H+/gluconate symporter-like permease
MANTAGPTKRIIASALIAGRFSIGNIIGPETFQAQDAPEYWPAKVTILATQAAAALLTVILFFYYFWSNRQKQMKQLRLEPEGFVMNGAQASWGGLTDKENLAFRYVY